MNDKNKVLKELIRTGRFLETRALLPSVDRENLGRLLFDLGYSEASICSYSYICFLIQQKESAYYHSLAVEILVLVFPHLEGSHETALYHVRRAIELDPNDIELYELLLLFHDFPQELIDEKEAISIARKIIAEKPESESAKRVLGL